jgi:hypothetical protein
MASLTLDDENSVLENDMKVSKDQLKAAIKAGDKKEKKRLERICSVLAAAAPQGGQEAFFLFFFFFLANSHIIWFIFSFSLFVHRF